ncbi:MAG: fasciclin domain-containing protein [Rhodobacteraceae bacterium]|nr:fasciclin domain-containing protein [Paracoccaceae bacterium]
MKFKHVIAALALGLTAAPALAESHGQMNVPIVGGAEMFPTKNIIENAVNSAEHTTLVAAVKAAGLVDALSGEGPFTVFAPTNTAFDNLPNGTVDTLLMPENLGLLQKVLTAHVVAGKLSAEDIISNARRSSDGFFHMETLSGDALSAQVTRGGNVFIFDENGSAYKVSQANVFQSNGVIHVVDGVLVPK